MESGESLKKIIGAVQTLPTLPQVAVKVNQLIQSPTAGAAELAKVVEIDQSLTAKILSLVNSAFYGLSRKVSNIQEGIAYVGMKSISQLVLGIGVIQSLKGREDARFSRKAFWIHCVGVAVISREIARAGKRHKSPEDVFTAGLLHDLGKVALDTAAPELFTKVLDELARAPVPFHVAEKTALGVDHSRIGEWVSRSWELPQLAVAVIKHHHEELAERTGFKTSQDPAVDIVQVADWAAYQAAYGSGGSPVVTQPPKAVFDRLALPVEQVAALAAKGKLDIEAAVKVLGL
jgi:HD-like signal output (HDOD) protein